MSAFTRTLVLSTAAIIFVRLHRRDAAGPAVRATDPPTRGRRPTDQLRRLRGRRCPCVSRDEFGDLTVAFNDMSRNLAIKEDLLNEQRRENDRLMLSLMPEQVVARYRDGEETIAQDHQDVTVIFADIVGLDELSARSDLRRVAGHRQQTGPPVRRRRRESRRRAGPHAAQRLPGQLRAQRAAHRQRPAHSRFRDRDAAHRRPVQRRDRQRRCKLRAGIDTGTVTSGLVGRSSLAYDMWGSAVDLAYQVQSGSPQPGRLRDVRRLRRDAGHPAVHVRRARSRSTATAQPIWRLAERQP